MKNKIKTVNIEKGMPTVDIAEKRLMFEITTAKREGVVALKIIHGYGSSGVGGGIKTMVRKVLSIKKRAGALKTFVSGEEWDIFNQSAREIMDLCNELRGDRDLHNQNHGITIVLL